MHVHFKCNNIMTLVDILKLLWYHIQAYVLIFNDKFSKKLLGINYMNYQA